jgi:hypothetical protein
MKEESPCLGTGSVKIRETGLLLLFLRLRSAVRAEAR